MSYIRWQEPDVDLHIHFRRGNTPSLLFHGGVVSDGPILHTQRSAFIDYLPVSSRYGNHSDSLTSGNRFPFPGSSFPRIVSPIAIKTRLSKR